MSQARSAGEWFSARNAEEFMRLLTEAHAQAKAVTRGLCPVEVAGGDLATALRELAADTEQRYGVPCGFECASEAAIEDATTATQLFHIARDAISCLAKEGKAAFISMTLGRQGDQVVLSVSEGKRVAGRVPDFFSTSELIMHYRARMIGANLECASAEDGGLVFVCKL